MCTGSKAKERQGNPSTNKRQGEKPTQREKITNRRNPDNQITGLATGVGRGGEAGELGD